MPPVTHPFLLGINYWPKSSAMAMWSRFDEGEIDEDFAHIAALGLDVVRFFLLWEAFQPAPDRMDPGALRRFERVIALASDRGLRTMPTLFTGHMSGVNWLPAWSLDPARAAGRFRTISSGAASSYGIGDFYGGALLDAQLAHARAVGERADRHPAVLAWDLGNEFSNMREAASPSDAARWSARLTHELQNASQLPSTGGLHGEDLTEDRGIRPSSISVPWPFATMHGYPAYSAFARSIADPEVVPFLAALTAGFSCKPVLFSEFGNPACSGRTRASGMPCLEEDAMAAYAGDVLVRLHARGALGAFWWCWTDYDPALAASPPFDLAPHELGFGIVRADGSEKPVARALAAFARERHSVAAQADAAQLDEGAYYAGLPGSTVDAYACYAGARERR